MRDTVLGVEGSGCKQTKVMEMERNWRDRWWVFRNRWDKRQYYSGKDPGDCLVTANSASKVVESSPGMERGFCYEAR